LLRGSPRRVALRSSGWRRLDEGVHREVWGANVDIICSDTTTLATFDSQAKQFFIMIVFDPFSEIHTWIKNSVKHTWKAWRTKEFDWGSSPSFPNVLH